MAIVGAGYTGLRTAYYLSAHSRRLRSWCSSASYAGFGASGRNGGWVSGFCSGPPRVYEARAGRAGYRAMQQAMFAAVEDRRRVLVEHAIDADFIRGGFLTVALDERPGRTPARTTSPHGRARGLNEDDLRLLDSRAAAERECASRMACRATYSPHVARVHSAKLLTGLAATVERLGVTIYSLYRHADRIERRHAATVALGRARGHGLGSHLSPCAQADAGASDITSRSAPSKLSWSRR